MEKLLRVWLSRVGVWLQAVCKPKRQARCWSPVPGTRGRRQQAPKQRKVPTFLLQAANELTRQPLPTHVRYVPQLAPSWTPQPHIIPVAPLEVASSATFNCLARCTTRGSTNTNNVGHQAALVPREANQRHCRAARLSLCLVAAAPVRWPRQLQIRRPQVVRRIFQPQSQDYHYLLYPLSRGYSQALFYFHEPATTRASLNQQLLRRAPHRAISHHHPRDSHHPYTKPPATICRRQTQTLRVKEGCPP